MIKCSVVLLSWTRPDNINIIVERYKSYKIIDEIIIWNNNNNFYISNNEKNIKIINCNKDFGLNTRFSAALLCRNRCVVLHDDDLFLSEANIINLVENFKIDYNRIYTYEGRNLIDGKYNRTPGQGRVENVLNPQEAEISLTRAVCFDKFLAAEYLKLSDVIFYDTDICLNAEDILLSYLSKNIHGKNPLVLPLVDNGYEDLPSNHEDKISTRANFLEERNKIIQRCEIVLPKPGYQPDPNAIFGPGSYPCAYVENSFCYNSIYSKILVEESSGIKYLSIPNDSKYDYTAAILLLEEPIKITKNLFLSLFFKKNNAFVKMQFCCISNNSEQQSKNIVLDVDLNYTKQYEINLLDLNKLINKNSNDDILFKSIKFKVYNEQGKDCELCITNISFDT